MFNFRKNRASYFKEPEENRQLARNFASKGNRRSLTATARKFVESARYPAINDARSPIMQIEESVYCAELCSLLAENPQVRGETRAEWKRQESRCLALMGEMRRLRGCLAVFIYSARVIAVHDAINPDLQAENPIYCAELCSLLAENPQMEETRAEWKRQESRCWARTGDVVKLEASIAVFIAFDRSSAIQDANYFNLQKENPSYCIALCRQLYKNCSLIPLNRRLAAIRMRSRNDIDMQATLLFQHNPYNPSEKIEDYIHQGNPKRM